MPQPSAFSSCPLVGEPLLAVSSPNKPDEYGTQSFPAVLATTLISHLEGWLLVRFPRLWSSTSAMS